MNSATRLFRTSRNATNVSRIRLTSASAPFRSPAVFSRQHIHMNFVLPQAHVHALDEPSLAR